MTTDRRTPENHGENCRHKSATQTAEILDAYRVQELLRLNTTEEPFVFDELLELFISETAAQMTVLRRAASASEYEAIRRTAHRLKGSSRSFGITLMGDQCEILEQLADSAEQKCIAEYIDQMEETFALAVRSLQRYSRKGA